MTTLVIYHFNCADGITSAWAARHAIPNASLWSAAYGEGPPYSHAAGRDVLVVDFSYPLAELRKLAEVARSVLVLDHHDTAREALAEVTSVTVDWDRWKQLVSDPEISGPHLAAMFDMERSGAGITWDYLHSNWPRPWFIDLVEDRDLWRFKHGDDSRRFHALLTSHGLGKEVLPLMDEWSTQPWKSLDEGEAILRWQRAAVKSIVDITTRELQIDGHLVPVACTSTLLSEVAHELLDRHLDAPFVGVYYDTKGKRKFSLRGRKGGVHVGKVAQRFGGGGHPAASGFDVLLGWKGDQ